MSLRRRRREIRNRRRPRPFRSASFTLAVLLIGALDCAAEPCITAQRILAYLQAKNSPIASPTSNATAFVNEGTLRNVDPRLVIGIAGAETTFGTAGICSQYNNAWNWFWCKRAGTCTYEDSTQTKCERSPFASWAEGITTVTKYLRLNYLNAGKMTISDIGGMYCGAGCEHWVSNVTAAYRDDLGGDTTNLQFSSCSACYPSLPAPVIAAGPRVDYQDAFGNWYTRYYLPVVNRAQFPDALFSPAPDLPPCGLNTNAARTWVWVYVAGGTALQGFCGFLSSSDLEQVWFAIPRGQQPPASVYIALMDRRCNQTYTSAPLPVQ